MLARVPKLIAFDLDGTLVESAPDLADAVDAMLERLGLPPAGETQVRGWIGNGADLLVKRALSGEMWPKAEPPLFGQGYSLFTDFYERNICNRSHLFPGVAEGLKQLKAEGYRTACITNKHSRFTRPLLDLLGILGDFDFVGCGDQFARHKPDPEPLLRTAEHFGVAPAECLMVGDSANDVRAARAAGYGVVCVPYGYNGGNPVERFQPDGVVASIADLPALLRPAA
jgi:phosphoglycolate phosphatase